MLPSPNRPYLFDTSAESWIARSSDPDVLLWLRRYLSHHQLHVSAITVLERIRGYALLWRRANKQRRAAIETARMAYLNHIGRVWPVDGTIAVVAAEIMALVPEPPTPPRRSHQSAETRQDRLVRWRFDQIVAATALVAQLSLVHNNANDFEHIRGAIERAPERFPRLGPLQLIRCASLVAQPYLH